jgi:hypothetical protein
MLQEKEKETSRQLAALRQAAAERENQAVGAVLQALAE